MIAPLRKGAVEEYVSGQLYLTIMQWEDGRVEVEINECKPRRVYHSCDPDKLNEAKELFEQLSSSQPSLITADALRGK